MAIVAAMRPGTTVVRAAGPASASLMSAMKRTVRVMFSPSEREFSLILTPHGRYMINLSRRKSPLEVGLAPGIGESGLDCMCGTVDVSREVSSARAGSLVRAEVGLCLDLVGIGQAGSRTCSTPVVQGGVSTCRRRHNLSIYAWVSISHRKSRTPVLEPVSSAHAPRRACAPADGARPGPHHGW